MTPDLFTRPGTVYAFHGDWRDASARWPLVLALLTDPPFGQRYESNYRVGWAGGTDGKRNLATSVAGDESTRERDDALDRLPWSVAAVFGPRRLDRIAPWGDPREVLAWDKGGVGSGDLSLPWKPSWETIAIYGDGWSGRRTDGVLRGSSVPFGRGSASNGRRHPNEKPLAVCAELVSKTPSGMPIADPFSGSGNMLVAAALSGRDAFGAEIDADHFASLVANVRAHGVTLRVF